MPFSFNPGQQQNTAQVAPQANNGVPTLVVPEIPIIATNGNAPTVEKLSPFAFKNRNKSKFGIYFQLVIFLIFGITLLTSFGLFIYQGILNKEIEKKKEALLLAQDGFPDLKFDEMQKFATRLKVVNRVMQEHASIDAAFRIFEVSVQDTTIYTKFGLNKDKTKKGYNIDLTAEASSYHAVYQQIETFKDKMYSQYLAPVKITNLSLDKKGIVSFKVSTAVSIENIHPRSLTFESSSTEVVKKEIQQDINNQGSINSVASTTP